MSHLFSGFFIVDCDCLVDGKFTSTRILYKYPLDCLEIHKEFANIPDFCYPDIERHKVDYSYSEFGRNEIYFFSLTSSLYGVVLRSCVQGEGMRYDLNKRKKICYVFVSEHPLYPLFISCLHQVRGMHLLSPSREGGGGDGDGTKLSIVENEDDDGMGMSFHQFIKRLHMLQLDSISDVELLSCVQNGDSSTNNTENKSLLWRLTDLSMNRISNPLDMQVTSSLAGNGVTSLSLLELLGLQSFMTLLSCILTEQRIIFVSADNSKVSAFVLAVKLIIMPFEWQHVYIPLLPSKLLRYLYAPMPFIVGIRKYLLETVEMHNMECCVVVDCDAGDLYTLGKGEVKIMELVGSSGSLSTKASEGIAQLKNFGKGAWQALGNVTKVGRSKPKYDSSRLDFENEDASAKNGAGPVRKDVVAAMFGELKGLLSSRPQVDEEDLKEDHNMETEMENLEASSGTSAISQTPEKASQSFRSKASSIFKKGFGFGSASTRSQYSSLHAWRLKGERVVRHNLMLFYLYLFGDFDGYYRNASDRSSSTGSIDMFQKDDHRSSFDIHAFLCKKSDSKLGLSSVLIDFLKVFIHCQCFEKFCESRKAKMFSRSQSSLARNGSKEMSHYDSPESKTGQSVASAGAAAALFDNSLMCVQRETHTRYKDNTLMMTIGVIRKALLVVDPDHTVETFENTAGYDPYSLPEVSTPPRGSATGYISNNNAMSLEDSHSHYGNAVTSNVHVLSFRFTQNDTFLAWARDYVGDSLMGSTDHPEDINASNHNLYRNVNAVNSSSNLNNHGDGKEEEKRLTEHILSLIAADSYCTHHHPGIAQTISLRLMDCFKGDCKGLPGACGERALMIMEYLLVHGPLCMLSCLLDQVPLLRAFQASKATQHSQLDGTVAAFDLMDQTEEKMAVLQHSGTSDRIKIATSRVLQLLLDQSELWTRRHIAMSIYAGHGPLSAVEEVTYATMSKEEYGKRLLVNTDLSGRTEIPDFRRLHGIMRSSLGRDSDNANEKNANLLQYTSTDDNAHDGNRNSDDNGNKKPIQTHHSFRRQQQGSQSNIDGPFTASATDPFSVSVPLPVPVSTRGVGGLDGSNARESNNNSSNDDDDVAAIRRKMEVLYTKNLPAKLKDIPILLEKYKGKEKDMLEKLEQRWGVVTLNAPISEPEVMERKEEGGLAGEEAFTASSASTLPSTFTANTMSNVSSAGNSDFDASFSPAVFSDAPGPPSGFDAFDSPKANHSASSTVGADLLALDWNQVDTSTVLTPQQQKQPVMVDNRQRVAELDRIEQPPPRPMSRTVNIDLGLGGPTNTMPQRGFGVNMNVMAPPTVQNIPLSAPMNSIPGAPLNSMMPPSGHTQTMSQRGFGININNVIMPPSGQNMHFRGPQQQGLPLNSGNDSFRSSSSQQQQQPPNRFLNNKGTALDDLVNLDALSNSNPSSTAANRVYNSGNSNSNSNVNMRSQPQSSRFANTDAFADLMKK